MKDPKKMYDKKAVKNSLKKYIILLICFLPILILLNFTLFAEMSSALMIFLDVVLCLCFVFVAGAIWNNISEKRREKREKARKQREQEEKRKKAQNCNLVKNLSTKKKGKRRNRNKNKLSTNLSESVSNGGNNKTCEINNVNVSNNEIEKTVDNFIEKAVENILVEDQENLQPVNQKIADNQKKEENNKNNNNNVQN